MRISSNMAYNDFLRNLTIDDNSMQKTMEQLTSGHTVSRSSDNPLIASKIMDLNATINQNDNYDSTINDAVSWSNTQDSAISSASTALSRIRTLIQSATNATSGAQEIQADKDEIQSNFKTIVNALNTQFDGRYLFSGDKTTTPPFSTVENADGDITGITYSGSDIDQVREIAQGVQVNLVTNGQNMVTSQGVSLGNFAQQLVQHLNQAIAGDKTAQADLGKQDLGDVDTLFDNLTNQRSQIGAINNQLQAADKRNQAQSLQLKTERSNKQDIDVAQKYSEYMNQMTTYKATLAMGTKVLQATVLDYL